MCPDGIGGDGERGLIWTPVGGLEGRWFAFGDAGQSIPFIRKPEVMIGKGGGRGPPRIELSGGVAIFQPVEFR